MSVPHHRKLGRKVLCAKTNLWNKAKIVSQMGQYIHIAKVIGENKERGEMESISGG